MEDRLKETVIEFIEGCDLPDQLKMIMRENVPEFDSAAPVAPTKITTIPVDTDTANFFYAVGLAVTLHAKHYSEVTQWRAGKTMRDVLLQIDNMTAELIRPIKPTDQSDKELLRNMDAKNDVLGATEK